MSSFKNAIEGIVLNLLIREFRGSLRLVAEDYGDGVTRIDLLFRGECITSTYIMPQQKNNKGVVD